MSQLELKAEFNGVCIKTISLVTVKDKVHVVVKELREDKSTGKHVLTGVDFQIFDKYMDAKMKFMGIVICTLYENANNTQETNFENLFQRGSFPYPGRRV